MKWGVLLLCCASCAEPRPTPVAPPSASTSRTDPAAATPAGAELAETPEPLAVPEGAKRYASLNDVDWKNYAYIPGLATLHDGYGEYREFSEEPGGLHDTTIWRLITVAMGDWGADGTEEAIVLLGEEYSPPSGPGSRKTRVFLYRLVDGVVSSVGGSFEVGIAESAAIYKDRVSLFVDGRCAMYQLSGGEWSETSEDCPGN